MLQGTFTEGGRLLTERKTIKEILGAHESLDTEHIRIFLGSSVEDVMALPPEKRIAGRGINAVENNTVASGYGTFSGCEGADASLLIITIDDSMERDDPNIRRYMNAGHTYPQAKTLHMYNLGMYGNRKS